MDGCGLAKVTPAPLEVVQEEEHVEVIQAIANVKRILILA